MNRSSVTFILLRIFIRVYKARERKKVLSEENSFQQTHFTKFSRREAVVIL